MADDSAPDLRTLLDRFGPLEAFRVLADLLPEAAVFVVDGERRIVSWSKGAMAVLGFKPEQAVGRLCLESIRCRHCTLGCGVALEGAIADVSQELYRADERWIRVRKFAHGFFDDDGTFLGAIEVLVQDGEPQVEEGLLADAFALPGDTETLHGLVSRDPGMQSVFQTIRNVAATDATVLARGDSGTGKELVAKAIHLESQRAEGPFVAVNCAALTPTLVESELFGHVRGAFTGAVSDRPGLFEQADGGTLFLDEIAELPLDMQSKLLRVLEERSVTRVGGAASTSVDVRVVAATHRALREEVKAGRFREDLMYRLRVVPLFLPPLRDRTTDVELLLRVLLNEYNRRGPRRVEQIAPEAMRALLGHGWPGNVRELRNVVEYAFAVGRGETLRCEDLPPELGAGGDSTSPIEPEEAPSEREQICVALEASGGRVGEAARRLGMSRSTFWRRRRAQGL